MISFFGFATGTGEILVTGTVRNEDKLALYVEEGTSILVGEAEIGRQFYDLNLREVRDKTEWPDPTITDSGSDVVFSPLPRPCTVIVGSSETVVSDGSAEINFAGNGTYTVTIVSVPYLPIVHVLTVGDVLLTEFSDLVISTEEGLGLAL
jgi:hypothetical protein